jgi:type I site-specific restriction endonuclease
MKSLNEADTRAKLIDPRLWQDGWTEDRIKRDVYIIPGKIIDETGKTLEKNIRNIPETERFDVVLTNPLKLKFWHSSML